MATPYLVLTDGTTTVTILNGTAATSYILESGNWAPGIAGKNRSTFGGKPYSDVTEEMTLHIKGSSGADCYGKLATLTQLLDQADAWGRGENVAAVQIQYAPLGATTASDSAPMKAVITGRADNSDEMAAVTLSNELDEGGLVSFIRNVRVRFKRRGLWLHSNQVASGDVANGTVGTLAFGSSTGALSPTRLTITNWYGMADAYVFVAPSASYLSIIPATDWTVYSGGANVTRTDNNDGTVTFAWGTTAPYVILQATIPAGFTTNAQLIDVYIRYGTYNTLVPKVRLITGTNAGDTVSQTAPLALTAGYPQVQFLGTLAAPPLTNSYTRLMLDFATVTGNVSIDIADVLLVARSTETYSIQIMRLNNTYTAPWTTTAVIEPRVSSNVTPLPYTIETNPRVFATYGDMAIHTKATSSYALIYAVYYDDIVGGGGVRRLFNWPASAYSTAPITNTITATRTYAYLTPQ